MRAELTDAEEAAAVTVRKEVYLKLHPETAKGATGRGRQKKVRQNGEPNERFTKDTAPEDRESRAKIQRAARRGKKKKGAPRGGGAPSPSYRSAMLPTGGLHRQRLGREVIPTEVGARYSNRPSWSNFSPDQSRMPFFATVFGGHI